MAGMKFTTKEVTEDTAEVSQNREFRRRFVGDQAELLNNLCDALQANFGIKGSQPQHVLIDALFRAAMRAGSLEFQVNGKLQVLDVSEASYGNVLGLLRETQSWETSKSGTGGAPSTAPASQPQGQSEAESAAGKQAPSLIPELTAQEMQLLASQAQPEVVIEEPTAPSEADQAGQPDSDVEGDAKNQLPMQLDEANESSPVAEAVHEPDASQSAPVATPDAKPARVKPAKPDFNAAMTGKKGS